MGPVLLAGAALLGGGIAYLCRSRRPIALAWLPPSQARLDLVASPVPAWLTGVLPDFLWAMALAASLVAVWAGQRTAVRHLWLGAGLLLGVGYELAQYPKFVPGTFDPFDLAAIVAGYGCGVLIPWLWRRGQTRKR